MCGIIAYKGHKNAVKVAIDGLKTLEYRGYDSWGIALKSEDSLVVAKRTGKIGDIDESDICYESNICIGHTRWATTGAVTEANAHPHVSMDGSFAVVHNGIIENYQELKGFLEENNFTFSSETDTEVIVQLIQYFVQCGKPFNESFREALLRLEGSFAVVAMSGESDKLMFGRRGSPLVVGFGENEHFIASDVPAFLSQTRQVMYVGEEEFGELGTSVDLFDLKTGARRQNNVQTISWDFEQAKKGDYPHFMLKEIYEQRVTVGKALQQDNLLMQKVTDMINGAFGIFFVGCGTSYHACVSASYVFSRVAKRHVNVVLASEFSNYEDFLTDRTLMVALSQSGETADLLDAVRAAKKKGVKILSVCNVMGSTLTRLSDENIMMNAGPEICVLSTKSYTSQLAILTLLAFKSAGRDDEGRKLLRSAGRLIPEVIENNLEMAKKLAKELKGCRDLFLIGRDLAFPSALEGALKVKEVSYIHAEGFAGGELKHGTIALIDKGVPVVCLATDQTRQQILSNAAEVKARGGKIIGIDSVDNEVYEHFIQVPDVSFANPILMIIPVQLLAYYLALERGCDPDKPRNLAKSVTVK